MAVHSGQENVVERFRAAANILQHSEGDLRERLTVAFVGHLWEIDAERDLPKRLQEPFQRLIVRITQDQVVGDKGTVATQLKKLDDDEVREIEQQVLKIARELAEVN